MNALLAPIAPQLAKLVRMLSSDSDGECLGAVRAIDRVLKANGRDWHDVAEAICPPLPAVRPLDAADWRDLLAFAATYMARLNDHERSFLRNLAHWRGPITPRQRDWLEAIVVRLQEDRQ